ncbi:MAG TPA: dihydrolipoamide acetyltransferase family protein [Candidatus Sulfotelmatobacter sp.]|nr:dihydrolipoamide acetyltransferase family protein [Candidatus Sulfotelmatobacter sp.]
MAFSVVMPALEMAQETGKLLAWRKKEGERVSKGEPLLEIETDKAVVEVEAPADGVLAGIKANEGAEVPVGQTIAWIVAPGEQPPSDSEPAAPAARAGSHAKTEHAAPVVASAVAAPAATSAKISPKARRLAKELGVDLANVRGSGAGGEILASDIEAAASAGSASPNAPDKIEVPSSIGRIMAERTTQSWTTVPHFFVSREIDATVLNRFREQISESNHGARITHTDVLVALVARVLMKHPRLNASWSADGIHLHDYVHMGLAIAVDDGVVAAVIHDAHTATLSEIATQRGELSDRARGGKLRPADIADATFTISNLGMYQVDQFSAIITPPQAAILAVGSIADRVVAVDGKPAVRPMLTLTVSCDHRVADGARAAMFLSDLAGAIGDPAQYLR